MFEQIQTNLEKFVQAWKRLDKSKEFVNSDYNFTIELSIAMILAFLQHVLIIM